MINFVQEEAPVGIATALVTIVTIQYKTFASVMTARCWERRSVRVLHCGTYTRM